MSYKLIYFFVSSIFFINYRAGLKTSLDEGTPAATVQEPDLGRVFDVAAYGSINFPTFNIYFVQLLFV